MRTTEGTPGSHAEAPGRSGGDRGGTRSTDTGHCLSPGTHRAQHHYTFSPHKQATVGTAKSKKADVGLKDTSSSGSPVG